MPIRGAAWLSAVASAAALAGVAGSPAGLWVLLPAGAALAAATVLRHRPEGRVLEAGAHAAAVVALLLTAGSAGHAAGVCTLWGLAIGLSALRPGEPVRVGLSVRVGSATGCELLGYWLLLASRHVAVLEPYTVPAARIHSEFVDW